MPLSPAAEVAQHKAGTERGLPRSPIDWCVLIQFPKEVSGTQVVEFAASAMQDISKTVRIDGAESEADSWRPLTRSDIVTAVLASIQLCDRRGAVSHRDLERFLTALTELAGRLGGELRHDALEHALKLASELDKFCADTDVQIGVNVKSKTGKLSGASIAAGALAAGGVLDGDGSYHFSQSDESSAIRMSNLESAKFSADSMGRLSTSAVTFEIDVPRAKGGEALVDNLFFLAGAFAKSVDGLVVDDNQRELSDASRASIRAAMSDIHACMTERGIAPGGSAAQRLYS